MLHDGMEVQITQDKGHNQTSHEEMYILENSNIQLKNTKLKI